MIVKDGCKEIYTQSAQPFMTRCVMNNNRPQMNMDKIREIRVIRGSLKTYSNEG
jgi:hypothetical protein